MDKKSLRKLYLQRRRDLHPSDVAILSQKIVSNFSSISFSGINYAHIFYPITAKHEFNSLLLASWLKEHQPGVKLVLPKSNIQHHTLSNILWAENTPLSVNQWGITEPEYGIEIAANKIDLVLVPLLAFDKQGHRLGYGKGFYDRFLATCRPDVQKIGISFFDPEERFEEVDGYDVPLNACITPEKIWTFM